MSRERLDKIAQKVERRRKMQESKRIIDCMNKNSIITRIEQPRSFVANLPIAFSNESQVLFENNHSNKREIINALDQAIKEMDTTYISFSKSLEFLTIKLARYELINNIFTLLNIDGDTLYIFDDYPSKILMLDIYSDLYINKNQKTEETKKIEITSIDPEILKT